MISGGLDKTDIDFVRGKVPCLESHPSAAAEEDGMVTALPQSPSHVVTSRLSQKAHDQASVCHEAPVQYPIIHQGKRRL